MAYRKPKRSLSPAQRHALGRLTPLEEAILEELIEAGEESLVVVANRLRPRFHQMPPEALLAEIAGALEGLGAADVIAIGRPNRGATGRPAHAAPEAMTEVASPTDLLAWDRAGGHWRWSEGRPGAGEIYLVMPIQVLEAFRLGRIS